MKIQVASEETHSPESSSHLLDIQFIGCGVYRHWAHTWETHWRILQYPADKLSDKKVSRPSLPWQRYCKPWLVHYGPRSVLCTMLYISIIHVSLLYMHYRRQRLQVCARLWSFKQSKKRWIQATRLPIGVPKSVFHYPKRSAQDNFRFLYCLVSYILVYYCVPTIKILRKNS